MGGFFAAEAAAAGDAVTLLSRRDPGRPWLHFTLGAPPPALPPADLLVHAAFDHLPGRYRGGEGTDPEGFMRRNRDGSLALFEAARRAGIPRVVFVSTRAVYGPWPPGTPLREDLTARPDTLYGRMKLEVETGLARMAGPDFATVSLRVTGVYGAAHPGGWHKWAELFADFAAGRPIPPRRGTEVHGADVAAALRCVVTAPPAGPGGRVFNVSDLDLDRHDLLSSYARAHGLSIPVPARADPPGPNVMDCAELAALGWQPGGWPRLEQFLATAPPGLQAPSG